MIPTLVLTSMLVFFLIELPPGDYLESYVNELIAAGETESETGEEYGMDRLMEYFASNSHKDLQEIHQDIIIELDNFKGGNQYKDDITMLSCRVSQ